MNSRERLQAVLEHRQPDRLCVDFGAGGQTGMGVCAVHRLRQAVLGPSDSTVKVSEPYQMLGEIDEALRNALQLDVVGILPPCDMFGIRQENFKPFIMPVDGTEVRVAGNFNYTMDSNGDLWMHPEGDLSAPPCARMPKDGYFWDSLSRQQPIDERQLDPMTTVRNSDYSPMRMRTISKIKWTGTMNIRMQAFS